MSETHDESLGSIILHHVTNDLKVKFFVLQLFGYDISITKHVIMLWIAAAITVTLAMYGTQRYRKNVDAQPKGLSHLYEILIDFIRIALIRKSPILSVLKSKYLFTSISRFFYKIYI